MSKERKAELQRKLAMTTVPRPPADLLDRIKADIPVDLGVPERDPSLWRSTLVMRVAASLMLLVTTGLVTWRVLQPEVRRPAAVSVQHEPLVPAITRSVTRPAEEAVEVPPVAETAANVLERPIVVPQSAPAPAPAKRAAPMIESAEEKDVRDFAAIGSTAQMADAADSSARREAESITVTASAPAVTEAAASAPAPPPPPPPMAAQRATAGAARKEAAVQKSHLFGVSVDANEFARVHESLTQGVRPRDVDVDAIVNHFAARAGGHTTILATGLSSSPLDPDRLLLSVSVEGESASRFADARLRVEFPSGPVREARRVGGGGAFTSSARPGASSMTVLYEIQPRTWLPPEAIIAEVVLERPTGRTSQSLKAGQTRAWKSASRHHRLVTLSGLWAESLSRSSTNVMLASLARELHEEDRSDPLARELSAAVEASTRTD